MKVLIPIKGDKYNTDPIDELMVDIYTNNIVEFSISDWNDCKVLVSKKDLIGLLKMLEG